MKHTDMAVCQGVLRKNADCVECVQPEDGAKGMIREVIAATTRIPVNFEKQVRGLQKVNVFLGDHIADDGQPGIQLFRDLRLDNASLSDHRESSGHLGVSVGIPLWVSGYRPSLELEGRSSGGSTPKVLLWNVESDTTYTDTGLAPTDNGTTPILTK